ncbi:hypothetical protein BC739_002513 [Kutzneria viridogrisea]|uniref:Uncharacterized protein n=1 Tax=Kutzneria viridogrisea TaxID=47990 RepID=A0ABR6BFE2_9PSEU|nr:hypothetical protein [Kutzneria viridogrisea]
MRPRSLRLRRCRHRRASPGWGALLTLLGFGAAPVITVLQEGS